VNRVARTETARPLKAASLAFQRAKKARGETYRSISELTHVAVATLKKENCLGFPSRLVRARIELGMGAAIWSKEEQLQERLRRREILGEDPVFITKDRLRALARNSALPHWGDIPNKGQFLAKLCAHLSARRAAQPISSSTNTHRHD
jgi:hypothetical protein